MTEKNTITLIIVALIGAIGAILAACIGLIPTILPIVRPTSTSTSLVFVSETFTPSNTPLADTYTATFAPPTETPTLTATLSPLETPTETQTTVPTPAAPSSDIDDYVGTWTTVDDEPSSDNVKLILTRVEVSKTSDTTANFSACRAGQKNPEVYVLPNPSTAIMYVFGLAARDFMIANYENLRWAIMLQRTGDQVVATVQEYDINGSLLGSDTFQLERPSIVSSITLDPCREPAAAQ